jgi:3-methylfumaryl-CoA hydratase
VTGSPPSAAPPGDGAVVRRATIDPGRVAALRALFECDLDRPLVGSALPPLWHWAALPLWAPSGALGPDGHADHDGLGHPEGHPRRMFAGGRVRMHRPMIVGDEVSVTTWVHSRTAKTGRSGPFVLAEQRIEIADTGGSLVLEERKDIVYRPAAPAGAGASGGGAAGHHRAPQPPAGAPLRREAPWNWSLATDPALLMRFSAATANAHRIHYDHPYATETEGYPGLVVHGPLMSIAVAEVLRRETDAPVSELAHRNIAPLFCGDPASIRCDAPAGARSGGPLALELAAGATVRTALDVTLRTP